MMIRPLTLALTFTAFLAAAAPASAATFHVAAPGTAGASDVTCSPCATIQGGIDAAATAAGVDTVHAAAGTYTERLSIGVGNDVTVEGSGTSTIVRDLDATPGTYVVDMQQGTVSNLALRDAGSAVQMYGGALIDVTVDVTSTPAPSETGVVARDGGAGNVALSRCTITLPVSSPTNYGFQSEANTGTSSVADSTITAGYGIDFNGNAAAEVYRDTVYAYNVGVSLDTTALSDIHNLLFYAQSDGFGGSGTGVMVNVHSTTSLLLTNSTFVGDPTDLNGTGLAVESNAGNSPSVTAIELAFVNLATHVSMWRADNTANPSVSMNRSLYDATKVSTTNGASAPATNANINPADPMFRNPAAQDFRLLPGSPLIDAGTPTPAGDVGPTDVRNVTRLKDGDGDGTAVTDIGAYEYQPKPTLAFRPVIRGKRRAGKTLTCSRGQWSSDIDTFSFSWKRGTRTIAGATSRRYRVKRRDRGKRLRCVVKATTVDLTSRTVKSAAVRIRR